MMTTQRMKSKRSIIETDPSQANTQPVAYDLRFRFEMSSLTLTYNRTESFSLIVWSLWCSHKQFMMFSTIPPHNEILCYNNVFLDLLGF